MKGPRSWHLIGESGDLEDLGWNGLQKGRLWRYHQHYFDDLNAEGAFDRQVWHLKLLNDWVANNAPGQGCGWEPYPVSLRVVNLIKWASRGVQLPPKVLHSLVVQIRWLTARLEYHLLGNHLFANAKALVMGGLFFEGAEADAWVAQGLAVLATEVPEQVLQDGGHFERSTMYHSVVLEDMLDLINVTRRYRSRLSSAQQQQIAEWPKRARSMLAWLKSMCHGDGEISFFNDAAFGVAPSAAQLEDYAHRLSIGLYKGVPSSLVHLKDSGYLRISHGPAIAILDVANVGPDYLPGHAHADTLSFELSFDEQRVLVNSGTSQYGDGPERLRQRGTAAHNTVTINGQNSSEVWSGFRVGRRAYPFGLHIKESPDSAVSEIRCAHDGYAYLSGHPIHRREWRMDESGMTVVDSVEGSCDSAVARFYFHPAMVVSSEHDVSVGTAVLPNNIMIYWHVVHGNATLEEASWHPSFGVALTSICLVVALAGGESTVNFRWNT